MALMEKLKRAAQAAKEILALLGLIALIGGIFILWIWSKKHGKKIDSSSNFSKPVSDSLERARSAISDDKRVVNNIAATREAIGRSREELGALRSNLRGLRETNERLRELIQRLSAEIL